MFKRTAQTLATGVFVLIPFALTIYLVWTAGAWLGRVGDELLRRLAGRATMDTTPVVAVGDWDISGLVGAIIVLVLIYCLGLLARTWLFSMILGAVEGLFKRLPGIKTIYESARDLLKLFGGGSVAGKGMGRAVLYKPPGAKLALMAIMTNEHPRGTAHEKEGHHVSLYLPMAFNLGGAMVYVPREHVEPLEIPVEHALKLCATGEVGGEEPAAPVRPPG